MSLTASTGMRIGLVHEWFVKYAGSERVVEQILKVFPEAKLYSVVDFLSANQRDFIQEKPVGTTFIQGLPAARNHFRLYLPLMPFAIGKLDLSGYDLIISSSHAVAKGVRTRADQLHISYVHTPMRYAWDLREQYLRESGLDRGVTAVLARWVLERLRIWDKKTAQRVHFFVANSRFVADRVRASYGRKAEIIYPPVDVEGFALREEKENFYLAASRMVPYKRMDLIVEAFAAMRNRELVVIGDGPEYAKAKAKSAANVTLLGLQDSAVLRDHMQRARAFVFAAEEDFGIIPVEAQACGTPVIAFGKGGARETVVGLDSDSPTGVFFERQAVEDIVSAVNLFEQNLGRFQPRACRENALRFSAERFRREFREFVEARWKEFVENRDASIRLHGA